MFKHPHALEFGHLVEIQIVRDDLGIHFFRHDDELGIHFLHVRKIFVDDADVDFTHLLDPVQNVEPAPSSGPFQRVGGIGDVLQLFKDEMRHEKGAVEKSGFAEIRNPPVDDDAGVEQFREDRRTGKLVNFLSSAGKLSLSRTGLRAPARDRAIRAKRPGLRCGIERFVRRKSLPQPIQPIPSTKVPPPTRLFLPQ